MGAGQHMDHRDMGAGVVLVMLEVLVAAGVAGVVGAGRPKTTLVV